MSQGARNEPLVRDVVDVCSLTSEQLEERIQEVRRDIAPHVRRSERLSDGQAWEFDGSLRSALEGLVALERQCCGSLDWRLSGAGDDGVRLEVHGIEPDTDLLGGAKPSASGGCGSGC